jgi:hypothetical protein
MAESDFGEDVAKRTLFAAFVDESEGQCSGNASQCSPALNYLQTGTRGANPVELGLL